MITDDGIVPIKGGQVKVLDDGQMKRLHEATVEVINEIGIRLLHEKALEIMKDNVCLMDNEILGAIFSMLKGIDCSMDAIGVDAFKGAGHYGKLIECGQSVGIII
ncbi:hypothetical protein ES703_16543 [subsurface metagenome]